MPSIIFNVHRCWFCESELMSVRRWLEGDNEEEIENSKEWHAVLCEECGAQGPRQLNDKDAVDAWNCGGGE